MVFYHLGRARTVSVEGGVADERGHADVDDGLDLTLSVGLGS